jgi:hypothetical protein
MEITGLFTKLTNQDISHKEFHVHHLVDLVLVLADEEILKVVIPEVEILQILLVHLVVEIILVVDAEDPQK